MRGRTCARQANSSIRSGTRRPATAPPESASPPTAPFGRPAVLSSPNVAPRRRPKPDRRRALELLASCRDGCTEAIMRAHGFTVAQLAELIRSGLAAAQAERVIAGGKAIEVARMRITEAGRRALADGGRYRR